MAKRESGRAFAGLFAVLLMMGVVMFFACLFTFSL